MAGLLARQETYMETSYPDKDYLRHQSLYGPVTPREYRTRPEPVRPQTTVTELYHHRGRLWSRSLVEPTEGPAITVPETTEYGHA